MRRFQLLFAMLISIALLATSSIEPALAQGKVITDKIFSPSLEGNLLKDASTRNVTIYLPPGYDENPDQRYPVVYLLHGWTGTNSLWTGGGYLGGGLSGLNIKNIADSLIQQGKIKPMILVALDANNRYWGSWYTNSPVTGNWEDFITQELVKSIDTTYRTLPQVQSRGIAGHSMGGLGALKLAIKYPQVYSTVYALSSTMAFDIHPRIQDNSTWITTLSLKEINQFSTAPINTRFQISVAAAFSPNPNQPPFFVDFPFELVDGELKRVELVWQKWITHDPVVMGSTHQANLRRLKVICFDCGTSDGLIVGNRNFSQVLTDAGIPHVFEEYPGDHSSGIRQRMETKVLPFFSDALAFEMLTEKTNIQPRDKLTMTWGTIKYSK